MGICRKLGIKQDFLKPPLTPDKHALLSCQWFYIFENIGWWILVFQRTELWSENFKSCISFCQKRTHGRWDDIGIDRHSCGRAWFIVGTIRYDKHCATKLSFLDVPIIDYLGATFTLISSGLMRPSAMIQVLSMHTNFPSFLRNVKGEIDFFFLLGVPNG